jgi:hypothetical protein
LVLFIGLAFFSTRKKVDGTQKLMKGPEMIFFGDLFHSFAEFLAEFRQRCARRGNAAFEECAEMWQRWNR